MFTMLCDSEEEENFFVGSIDKKTEVLEDACFTAYKINGKAVKFKIDTGSQVFQQAVKC